MQPKIWANIHLWTRMPNIEIQIPYHEVKSIKTDRYQTQTENIKPGSFFRYPTITWPISAVVISNRYQAKKRNPASLCEKQGFLYHT
jgi:hypothetical protein